MLVLIRKVMLGIRVLGRWLSIGRGRGRLSIR